MRFQQQKLQDEGFNFACPHTLVPAGLTYTDTDNRGHECIHKAGGLKRQENIGLPSPPW